METLLIVFIAVTSIAVIVQMGVLIALYASVKRTGERVDALSATFQQKGLPVIEKMDALVTANRPRVDATLESAQRLLASTAPKMEKAVDNLVEISEVARAQVGRAEAAINDVLERTQQKVVRADELLTKTMDRVEYASDAVHNSVTTPLRHASGLIQALSAGFSTFGKRQAASAAAGHGAGNSGRQQRPTGGPKPPSNPPAK